MLHATSRGQSPSLFRSVGDASDAEVLGDGLADRCLERVDALAVRLEVEGEHEVRHGRVRPRHLLLELGDRIEEILAFGRREARLLAFGPEH